MMDALVAQQLLGLNRRFYQSFAESFSATRARLQPGVLRVLETIPGDARILDLGCGGGELARELAKRGFQGDYTGLDFSAGMLAFARENAPAFASFQPTDLAAPDWDNALPAPFDFVLAFAVLHHLPGRDLRLGVLDKVRALLVPDGRFVHSNWQFLNSPRLRARIQPWDAIGLDDSGVDEGDHLLDWRRDGEGLRYVHHFSEAELADLARESGFHVAETFYSDGEGGKLGLYQIWAAGGSGGVL
jgi:SAM-dependent methyltransferase